jgi:hypothetical protein
MDKFPLTRAQVDDIRRKLGNAVMTIQNEAIAEGMPLQAVLCQLSASLTGLSSHIATKNLGVTPEVFLTMCGKAVREVDDNEMHLRKPHKRGN